MATSPNNSTDGLFTYQISDDSGNVIGCAFTLVSFKITREVNAVGRALLTFEAADTLGGTNVESDAAQFDPQKRITISAGYGADTATLFEGIVTTHSSQTSAQGLATLQIDCRETAYYATRQKADRIFAGKTDRLIIEETLADYSFDLTVDDCDIEHEQVAQHGCTDWDFALSRAALNGFVTTVNGNSVTMKKPAVDDELAVGLTYGSDVIEFAGTLNTIDQFARVVATAWDASRNEEISAESTTPTLNDQGSDDQGPCGDCFTIKTDAPLTQPQLQIAADAKALQMGLSRISGTCKFNGNNAIEIGKVIALTGFGRRFDGKAYIGAVEHNFDEQGWTTTITMGIGSMNAKVGKSQAISGLHIGKVVKTDGDPTSQHRVQVSMPIVNNTQTLLWARLGNFWGSNGYGSFFVPGVGDEVILGFFDSNPSSPVILGSMYSGAQPPPYELTSDNFIQGMVTKSKICVEFDDENKVVTIRTPAGNTIRLSDHDKGIELTDQNQNTVVMNRSGIAIESDKGLTLKAGGGIEINAGAGLKVAAKTDLKLEGMNVELAAKTTVKIKGTAGAELSASGTTTVKGGVVMIN